jgi:hypothetical protein
MITDAAAPPVPIPFADHLRERLSRGPLASDEIVYLLGPLFDQVGEAHARGRVAPLQGLNHLKVAAGRAYFAFGDAVAPARNPAALARIDVDESRALEIQGRDRIDETATTPAELHQDLSIGAPGGAITRPIFLPGYICWEHEVGHHDELTDVFSLGLLLASLATGLDLSDQDDLRRFVGARENLFALNQRIHPVMAKLITRMTSLERRWRAQDLPGLTHTLLHHREQRLGLGVLEATATATATAPTDAGGRPARSVLLRQLRERLFELTRRNRLLYFKPTLGYLNLTVGSVPLLLDYRTISPDSLFTWRGEVADALSNGKSLPLGRYLRFEDAAYLPSVLDRIRSEERRDRAEFGFSQLRVAICFLRWHNLKEAQETKQERITSPLVLLPVEVEKRKGVRDAYILTPTTSEAEVNPVLRHQLRQLYGLELPETIDLQETTLPALHEQLARLIAASEPGITLRLIDRPQIRLVHEKARVRLEQFRRRERLTGRGIRKLGEIDYSYARDNFQPLGLQMFLRRVRPSPAPRRELVDDRPQLRPLPLPMVAPADTVDRDLYVLQTEKEANPYSWDFDLCSVTLGNFNYRKMTLVRDYTQLVEGDAAAHGPFDAIFSFQPRAAEERPPPAVPLRDQHAIVEADPTQTAAIARARGGGSYIIQGPPGTGKSQTITNLVADYVARDKRVLFVCEKRAAIDVVHHRLKQAGLDRLCALIHDSQGDKKPFIQDLKATYERYLAEPDELEEVERRRADAVVRMEAALDAMTRFSEAMVSRQERDGVDLRQIFARLVALAAQARPLSDADAERMPAYADWLRHQSNVRALAQVLEDVGAAPVLARHPVAWLSREIVQEQRPLEAVTRALDHSVAALGASRSALRAAGLDAARLPLADIAGALDYASRVQQLADLGLLRLLDRGHADVRALRAAVAELDDRRSAVEAARQATVHWKEKLPRGDLEEAIALARAVAGPFGFFKPSWWRLRKVLVARYDFGAHAVKASIKPSWTRVLEELLREYDSVAALAAGERQALERWGTSDLGELWRTVTALHDGEPQLDDVRRSLRARLLEGQADARAAVTGLMAAAEPLQRLRSELDHLRPGYARLTLEEVERDLGRLREALAVLPDLLPRVRALAAEAPGELWSAIREIDQPPDTLEAAILQAAVLAAYRRDRSLPRQNGQTLATQIERAAQAQRELRALNAERVLAGAHAAFRGKVERSGLPAAQLEAAEKEWKREWSRGRRELEHELAKVMRFRSIRDLATGDTGLVLADLKPIWLMSPLSVSDTLPLDTRFFDVVIYDEASQIPLEEAIPALYRASQTIVVGDRQQLPPTDFFSSKRAADEDEDGAPPPVDDDDLGFELDSDSFLTQAAANLPATLLGWHYRSRSEGLISFSNAAFYEGRLLTIPDRATSHGTSPISVTAASDGDASAEQVLDRPVSFHLLGRSPYQNRRNSGEAGYIAHLVRSLLQRKTGMSLGVVAFSQAQQDEIEGALAALARDDEAFDDLLEAEYLREEDDQFRGLFVKNLENVQGDERDVIIISICYGPDPDGRMLMNFGPINKDGGERRLNVVFSRARRHMVVVSSIRHTAITNEYNDGANCLRRYLEYAEALSRGDRSTADRVLDACCPARARTATSTGGPDAIVKVLSDGLSARGFDVTTDVGASHLRCDLAVRSPGAPGYELAVLIDTPAHYRSGDAMERYLQRPGVLSSAGWATTLVLAKDVHEDPQAVMRRIEARLREPGLGPQTSGLGPRAS